MLELVEEALNGRVVQETELPGEYRFSHALIQETLLSELSTTRRVRLHGRLAEALERLYDDQAARRAAELALHFVESATLTRSHVRQAANYSRLAAEQAEADTAWDEAARHYQNCLEFVLEAEDRHGQDEADLLAKLSRSWAHSGEPSLAQRSLIRAMDVFQQRDDAIGLAKCLVVFGTAVPGIGRSRTIPLSQEALAGVGDSDLHLKANLLAIRAGLDWDEVAMQAAERASELAQAYGFTDVQGRLLNREARHAREEMRLNDAVLAARAGFEAMQRSGNFSSLGSLGALITTLLLIGNLDDVEAAAGEALAWGRRLHVRPTELNQLVVLASLTLLRGDFDRFEALAAEAPFDHPSVALLRAARAELSGDFQEALARAPSTQWVRQVREADLARLPTSLARVFGAGAELEASPASRATAHGIVARIHFNAGHEEASRAALAGWADALEVVDAGNPQGRALAYGEVAEALPELAELTLVAGSYQELLGWKPARIGSVMQPTGWGAVGTRALDALRGALALRLGKDEEAEEWYRIGLEWAERERCPIEQGRCLQGLAEVAERRGERTGQMQYLDRAAALFQRYGAKLYLDQVLKKKEILRA